MPAEVGAAEAHAGEVPGSAVAEGIEVALGRASALPPPLVPAVIPPPRVAVTAA